MMLKWNRPIRKPDLMGRSYELGLIIVSYLISSRLIGGWRERGAL